MEEERKDLIRFRTILEVLGKPKEHVQNTIRLLVEKIKENPGMSILNEEYAELKPQGSLWSTFVELEIIAKGITTLIGFCFDFMPSSIDIEKPELIFIKNHELSNIFNDLQAKLHNVDMVAKKLRAERDFLKRNLNTMITNAIAVLIKINKNTLEELSKYTGINKKEMRIFLDKLLKEGKIKKEEDKYTLI